MSSGSGSKQDIVRSKLNFIKEHEEIGSRLANEDGVRDLASNEFDTLFNKVEKAYSLVNDQQTREIDAINFKKMSNITSEHAYKLSSSARPISLDYFKKSLNKKARNWEGVGDIGCKYIRAIPKTNFIVGVLELPQPKKRQRTAKTKTKDNVDAPVEKPKIVEKSDNEAAGTMKIQSERQTKLEALLRKELKTHLQDGKEIYSSKDFFEVVLNPKSFTQTVENIFDMTFLVKEGKASLKYDDEKKSIRVYTDLPPSERSNSKAERQAVAAFSYKDFLALVDAMASNQSNGGKPYNPFIQDRSRETKYDIKPF